MALTIARIASIGLSIVAGIIGKTNKARINCEDRKMLRELAEQTKPLLNILSKCNLRDEQVKKYLNRVVEALRSADAAIENYNSRSVFSKTFRTSKVASELRQATTKLIHALSMLGSSSFTLTTRLQKEIDCLQDRLETVSQRLDPVIEWKSEKESQERDESKALVIRRMPESETEERDESRALVVKQHYQNVMMAQAMYSAHQNYQNVMMAQAMYSAHQKEMQRRSQPVLVPVQIPMPVHPTYMCPFQQPQFPGFYGYPPNTGQFTYFGGSF